MRIPLGIPARYAMWGVTKRGQISPAALMHEVVPSAVMNAVSAAMSIFTAIEIIRDLVIVVAN